MVTIRDAIYDDRELDGRAYNVAPGHATVLAACLKIKGLRKQPGSLALSR